MYKRVEDPHVMYTSKKVGDADSALLLPGLLVVSNQLLYVFAASAGDNGLSILGKHEWHEFRLFQVGVGRHSIRISSTNILVDVRTGDDEMLWSLLRTLSNIPQIADCPIEWFDFNQLAMVNRVVPEVECRDDGDAPFESGPYITRYNVAPPFAPPFFKVVHQLSKLSWMLDFLRNTSLSQL